MPRLSILWLLLGTALATPSARAQEVDYNGDVRPILAQNCFKCHGPDAADRKADLRLDVEGQAQEAPILARITSADPGEVMPPPSSGKSLTDAQIAILKRWLQTGARYEQHWAFKPPAQFVPPESTWQQHPVDKFVRHALREQNRKPSPRANKAQLLRRVSLDLIGLLPTPEEIRAFEADDSEDAYLKVVDRLLASPHYGERQARRWLDIARYADTNGYEKDRHRSIWPYRDWVIRAFNRDLPYDQFIVEQIAGDMLPDATEEQIIATGFHRNTMLNEEGGIDPLEFRYYALVDRVSTTGTAVLGLTVGCAQCHTHKFDPLTHDEYFGMMAFLDQTEEPDYAIVADSDRKDHERRLREARSIDLAAHWPSDAPPLEDEFKKWTAAQRALISEWRPLPPTRITSEPRLRFEVDAEGGAVNTFGDVQKYDIFEIDLPAADRPTVALRLEALPSDHLPNRGPGTTYFEGRKGDFFVSEVEIEVDGRAMKIRRSTESNAKRQKDKWNFRSHLAWDGDVQTGWGSAGKIGQRSVAIFELEEPIPAGQPVHITMHFSRHYPATLGRFRWSGTDELRGDATHTRGERQDLLLGTESWSETDRDWLQNEFLMQSPRVAKQSKRIRDLQRAPRRVTTLVMRERPEEHRRTTHRHHRGEFLQPRETIEPHTPDFLHAFPEGSPRNRLTFARWLVSPDSPLTARVAVNREWAALFGRGLVPTTDDFGVQGQLPSHPALLERLAAEFVAHGWSIKWLHRLLVTSETYCQDARVRPEDTDDPDNVWLARGPRFRLDGEVLRDALLQAAGLLDRTMFGAPVRPPQPAGVTEVAYGKPKWNPNKNAARFRRSVYTYQKRTAPFAFYATFDAPSGEACMAQRDRSNTPLQALTLLNDPMIMEIARGFGQRIAKLPARSDGERIDRAFEILLSRRPNATEHEALVVFLAAERARGGDDVWTTLARVLFGLDETITRN